MIIPKKFLDRAAARTPEQVAAEQERLEQERDRELAVQAAIQQRYDAIGRVWIRGEHRRLYLAPEAVAALVGLEIARYHTGNIRWAAIDGEEISNGEAHRMLDSWEGAWIDLDTDQLHISMHGSGQPRCADEIMTAYMAAKGDK